TDNDTIAIAVSAVDDPATTRGDVFATDENVNITAASVFADNGAGSDDDPDGPPLAVSAVNGSAAAVGTQITLPSGALLTLNPDGTFSYNPNGTFDELPDPGSGATNTSAVDTFAYTANGATATVTITITGIDT